MRELTRPSAIDFRAGVLIRVGIVQRGVILLVADRARGSEQRPRLTTTADDGKQGAESPDPEMRHVRDLAWESDPQGRGL